MRRVVLSLLAIAMAFALSITGKFPAQTQNAPAVSPHPPSSPVADIRNSEIEALVRKMATEPVADRAIRIVSINGEYNVGMGVVSRLKTTGK